MFARWGDLVYRARFTVIAVMVAGLLALGAYGSGLGDHLSQSGWDDPGSESVAAAKLADGTFGRDTNGDVVAMYTAPEGKTVDDPEFTAKVTDSLQRLVQEHPDEVAKFNGSYFTLPNTPRLPALATEDRSHAIVSVALKGDNDTAITNNFREVRDAFDIDGVEVQLAGMQPVASAINDTMANDLKRMELIAIPAVGVLLFFVFGGVIAAALPLIVGGLTILSANGIVRVFTHFAEINVFVASVVSLIGLGLAIDYGLFIVSRFREELGDGRNTKDAVRRTVMTAGRTVLFSATMIAVSLGGLILFPQGFLKSVAYGAIATVLLAAFTSVTVLPAILSILGRRIDKFGLKRFGQIKSTEEIESSIWGRLTRWVMRNPIKVTIPIVVGLLLMIIPLTGIKFGGINEDYLPTNNPTRMAQEQFDELFPGNRTEPVKLVIEGADGTQVGQILKTASGAPGLVEKFSITGPAKDGVQVLKAGLVDRNDSAPTIDYLRAMDIPDGVDVLVGGTPAIEQDSISALLDNLPLMIVTVLTLTTLLMFLAFGSLVLPIKAVLMSALGLGATLGILTWIFIDGHGSGLLNFTPGPITSPVLVLIVAIIYGLSIDYEVFLLSRMVEARSQGASTTEAIRIGTAHTGRIITAAALILIVVTGAFGFSELVMMKYIAYGMISALVIDATLIRMFLVPAVMKLLGDDCWWAPAWMKRIQEKVGLGEPILDSELPGDVPELTATDAPAAAPNPEQVLAVAPAGATRDSDPLTQPIPRIPTTPRARAATPRRGATRPEPSEQPQQPTAPPTPEPVATAPAPKPERRPRPSTSDDDGEVAWLAALRAPNTGVMPVVKPAAAEPAPAPEPRPAPAPEPVPAPEPAARHGANDDLSDTDTGRHRRGDGVAVSVSELLARHRDDD
ncbi:MULTISPECIES: MMPL family transporter [unclassified Rhodococcus (in: high G+C Gram-positive bacteria)]|uniref:MMPL family transporter n=1 Tax=unclassified Rhodococcus (in: high G+C Gram-positive bacteria) TaxID=192944 RepID=UPI000E0C5B3D|nr:MULTISPECIES: MMPL family transporter [unclassified Rhodococcus (in: high G+C Gram-positive bacteria)]QKT13299.1 MMPL family transporter [Rhodococcus sp. W8901]RDI18951.1 RND superfamily putative drug exporter [Rhodococcus sp. AG1013]